MRQGQTGRPRRADRPGWQRAAAPITSRTCTWSYAQRPVPPTSTATSRAPRTRSRSRKAATIPSGPILATASRSPFRVTCLFWIRWPLAHGPHYRARADDRRGPGPRLCPGRLRPGQPGLRGSLPRVLPQGQGRHHGPIWLRPGRHPRGASPAPSPASPSRRWTARSP